MIGKRLAHYEITGLLGKGGMGEVYRASDTRLKREVALKVLAADVAADAERLERFQREAELVAALNHPSVVVLYAIEERAGTHFLTMELVDGQPLSELIPEGGLPLGELVGYAVSLAEAVSAAHDRGITHRDLKPANVMVDGGGRIKVLDFGLAKLIEPLPGENDETRLQPASLAASLTDAGSVLGTLPYMSPEQAEGKTVDHRTDIFSLGVVLYEMITGSRPFQGDSQARLLSSILTETPSPIAEIKADLPQQLDRIVSGCLAKEPAERFQTADEVLSELRELQLALSDTAAAPVATALRRPLVRVSLASAALLVLAALGGLAWRANRANWARNEALPQVARLAEERRYVEATALAERAERFIPEDPVLLELWPEIAVELSVESEPSAVLAEVRAYAQASAQWQQVGQTPVPGLRLPKGAYRWRFSKPGSETVERAAQATEGTMRVQLPPAGSVPEGMVLVPNRVEALFVAAFGLPREIDLDDYYIQRHEVTNREYKGFVEAGGYRRPELWKHAFVDNGRTLPWDEAMTRFHDQAGQPGPATWEVGAYPAGQDDWPVGGVSWYEAAAYAEFAGLSLPTLSHWYRAAGVSAGPYLLELANFDYQGSLAVGTSGAMSPLGTFDMAGNVKEWASNGSSQGQRYSVGGGWGEPQYMFGEMEARSAFDRQPKNGFRLAKYTGSGEPDARSAANFDRAARDYRLAPPVSDATFTAFARMQQYAAAPLDVRIEKKLESAEARVVRVSFTAAYPGERVVAYLWLPKGIEPPYQTLILFPGGEALRPAGGEVLEQPDRYDFLLRSGRAVVHPVYRGMYERFQGSRPADPIGFRDYQLRWSLDVRRTLDYLETRPDIDPQKTGFFGASMGAWFAPLPLAIEPRLSLAILVGGGLSPARFEPEVDTLNYLPRVKQPLLLLCGRYDYFFPYEASQKPFFERLGTPAEHKRHVVVDSGHSVPRTEYLTEMLRWLDKYFGPARGEATSGPEA